MHNYSEIFSARARQYHYAMQCCPQARDAEFQAIVQDLPDSAVTVLDVPSGGGYLQRHLNSNVQLHSCDFSEGFAQTGVPLASPTRLSFADAVFDAVLSLTGLHHVPHVQQDAFLGECLRVLRPGARLLVGEVWRGSSVDFFLNDFVHRHNSQGHVGEFFDDGFLPRLQTAGFAQATRSVRSYFWQFESVPTMVDYCRNLFGIDNADDEQIEAGLRDVLDYKQTGDGRVQLHWQLVFFQAVKR